MSDEALQYSHSGSRYLLGYGSEFFGIWDRTVPGAPIERFPRNDAGWRSAWTRFVGLEPEHVAVGLRATPVVTEPSAPTPAPTPTRAARATGPVEWWWWLVPFLFGWIGGLFAWNRLRRRDRRAALNLLLVGIATSAVLYWWYASTGGTL